MCSDTYTYSTFMNIDLLANPPLLASLFCLLPFPLRKWTTPFYLLGYPFSGDQLHCVIHYCLTIFQRASWGPFARWLRLHLPTNHKNVSRSDKTILRLTFISIFFQSYQLNGVLLIEIRTSSFCAKKNSAGRETLYRVRKPGAFLSSCEPGQRRRRWHQLPKTAAKSYVSTALPNM
jgi:hypothetical protein